MRGFFVSAALLGCICLTANAQEGVTGVPAPDGQGSVAYEKLDSVVVSVSRAGKNTPVTFTMVNEAGLRSSSPSNSLPMVLNLQPSVVATNEGGTGLGYSKLTVRGSKGSQINVTLNGITLNDSESQEVFWVNIPALGNILNNVQLQRGLGTSANGSGAFGASINMSTAGVSTRPFANFEAGYGSYNTFTTTLAFGSGLTRKGFYANFAYSKGTTDGYIRNAWGDVQSVYGELGRISGSNSLKFTLLSGSQHTGITWEGIPQAKIAVDRTYNPTGKYKDALGNVRYYDNDSDNYDQTHLQLNFTHRFSGGLNWSTTLNYTDGYGYYEQYKTDKKPGKYGLPGPVNIGGVDYKYGDFITRKLMDNGYWVLNSDLSWEREALSLVGGVYLSSYDGDHFGEVRWCNLFGDDYDYSGAEWYRNNGRKREATAFARGEWQAAGWLTVYAEAQYRHLDLKMEGPDEDFSDLAYDKAWNFFNPRAGVTGRWGAHKAYASVALGHREPGRSDLKEQVESANALGTEVRLKPESMVDTELGYAYESSSFSASVNLYSMEYRDMLLETGKLSDSGYAIKENVPRSWRRGIELAAAWKPWSVLQFDGNLSLSTNKIADYTFYMDVFDNSDGWNIVGQKVIGYGETTMLMSPSVVGMGAVTLRPCAGLRFSVSGKYVGKQYWDNSESAGRSIPSYFVMDGSAEWKVPFKKGAVSWMPCSLS